MATVDDFVGLNCPYCGAVDSLETDEARGEVACTECARVVAMGLEENVLTRFNKDATYDDVDHHAGDAENADATAFGALGGTGEGSGGGRLGQASSSTGLSRTEAAALAAGVVGPLSRDANSEAAQLARYAKVQLHPKMRRQIDNLCHVSRRSEDVVTRAVTIAKQYVGYRRDRGLRLEHQRESAAACFLLATEMCGQPVPVAELRVLDPSIGDVESCRRDVVAATKMDAAEKQLREVFASNLLRYYIRLLHLQMIRYEVPCLALLEVLKQLPQVEMAQLVDADRAVIAVLLARMEPSIQWEGKPPYDAAIEPRPDVARASFASSAHLNAQRVHKLVETAQRFLPEIRTRFVTQLATMTKASTTATATATDAAAAPSVVKDEPAPSSSSMGGHSTEVKSEGLSIGVKREREE